MKKINLTQYVNETALTETSLEAMERINGGCTSITVGRCSQYDFYLIERINPCGNGAYCTQYAVNAAKMAGIPIGGRYTYPQ